MTRKSQALILLILASVVAILAIVLVHLPPRPVIVLGISDPLAAKSASDCVRESARRDYDAFAEALGKSVKRKVLVRYYPFDAQLSAAMKKGEVNAVIGKTWTVMAASYLAEHYFERIADMPGPKGTNDLTGVFIVRADSPIRTIKDLGGKSILLGPSSAYEKSFAARAVLYDAGIDPGKVDFIDGCVPLAAAIAEKSADAGVISSYVAEYNGLSLVGGAAKFREITRTKSVPFMTVAVSADLPADERAAIRVALFEMTGPKMPKGLLTTGFTEPAVWEPGELK